MKHVCNTMYIYLDPYKYILHIKYQVQTHKTYKNVQNEILQWIWACLSKS